MHSCSIRGDDSTAVLGLVRAVRWIRLHLSSRSNFFRERRILRKVELEFLVIEERMKVAVQPWSFKIPVNRKNAQAMASKDPRYVGEGHRTSGAALIRIERK